MQWVKLVQPLSFARGFSGGKLPVLTLFTKRKEQCSLCEVAKAAIQHLKSKFIYEEVYIDDPENTEWYKKYCYDIPVVHINGEFFVKHKIDVTSLETKLSKEGSQTNVT